METPTVELIMRYEAGETTEEETLKLFQRLLDEGLIWSLQGHYQRMAQHLIDSGLILQDNNKDGL